MEPSQLEIQAYAAQDRFRLAVAQNVTTNGRLFSALLVAINLVVYLKTGLSWFAILAVFAAAPVGLACIADQLKGGMRSLVSFASYAISILVAFLFLLTIGS
jgi:hypothetical protein